MSWKGLTVVAAGLVALSVSMALPLNKEHCRDFDTQAEAQRAFEGGLRALDGDRDGVACESLP